MQLHLDIRCAIWSEVNMLISGGDSLRRRQIARLIHELTHPRGDGEFLEVSPNGSGAVQRVRAFLKRGIAGTIFFEEAAGLDTKTQQRLLPVLHTGVDTAVRVIAATGVDLFERVRKATFSADLYYRLNAIHLVLDPRACMMRA